MNDAERDPTDVHCDPTRKRRSDHVQDIFKTD